MRVFRRIISAAVCILVLAGSFTGCGNVVSKDKGKKAEIVTTVFPIYDWVRNILGDRCSDFGVRTLLDGGVDMHSFTPSAADIREITESKLFIFIGGESDNWVDGIFGSAENSCKQLSLIDALEQDTVDEERKEGMQRENGTDDPGKDEHIWMSLRLARKCCDIICEKICSLDADGAAYYRENCKAYKNRLAGLDALYTETLLKNEVRTLIVCDRFPFRYLAEDYGLDYYAAFSGCSAESEAGFETITFLSRKADELGAKTLFVTESSDKKIASTVRNNTHMKSCTVSVLDSMQSVTAEQIENGTTYLGIMEKNLAELKKAG